MRYSRKTSGLQLLYIPDLAVRGLSVNKGTYNIGINELLMRVYWPTRSNLLLFSLKTRRYHVFHMHGHQLAVLAEEFPTYSSSTGQIVMPNANISCGSDVLCAHPQWSTSRPYFEYIQRPVLKNAIVIPIGGYVVLQFKTNNPGYWMVHCHLDMHMLSGMTTVFKVAPDRFPRLPLEFPTCAEFV